MATGKIMKTTQAEIKAVAKAVGASLGRQGHEVPHSVVLHAMAAALDKRDWQTLKASISKPVESVLLANESITDELPLAYNDQARFWVKLAYFNGTPLTQLPNKSAEAVTQAREKIGPVKEGVLRFQGWNLPVELDYETSKVDAGTFEGALNQIGILSLRFNEGSLEIEVTYTPELGWYMTNSGSALAYQKLAQLVSDSQVIEATMSKEAPEREELLGFPVHAEFWSDDRVFEVNFDARLWLMQASEKEISEVIHTGYRGDYSTDNIAEFMEDKVGGEEIKEAYAYIHVLQRSRKNDIGSECLIDKEQMLKWLAQHRTQILANILCERHDVTISEAQEEEIRGMWDWLYQNDACEHSFDTAEEAKLDAYRRLDLLSEELSGNLES